MSPGGSVSCSMRWLGRGSRSPKRRSGKLWISATVRATYATLCRPISTSITPEESAIFPARPSTFSPTSFEQLRALLASSSGSDIAACRSRQSRSGRRFRKKANSWFGFSAVRAIPGTRDDVLLVPLPGHTRGHCGVAVKRQDDWLLHCGDAYFLHSELERDGGAAPKALRWLESRLSVDDGQRGANQARLRELACASAGEVKLICSHDLAEFAAMRTEERENRIALRPVSAPRRPSQGDVRAAG